MRNKSISLFLVHRSIDSKKNLSRANLQY